MATEETKPRLILISLNFQPSFDDTYGSTLAQLRSKANLYHAKEADSAIRLLSDEPTPLVVLITDEALSINRNVGVWNAVLQYVRHGGTSVVMGNFPSFVRPSSIKPFFTKAGLQTLVLNQESRDYDSAAKLPSQCNPKALFVKNVALSDAWYVTDESAVVQSSVFGPTSANIMGETPIALARVSNGKLGYIGDVNAPKKI
ncbi:hypothetical protein AUP68_07533 [Ilyonectria robusta]